MLSNNNENSTNNTSNESGCRDSGALLSYNNKSKTFVLPQFVSYCALEIILSMLSIHDFFKLSMEDVFLVCIKEQEFLETCQPQLSRQFNFHSEYLQRLLRTRTLDADPEWFHKLQLNYTISLQRLEIQQWKIVRKSIRK